MQFTSRADAIRGVLRRAFQDAIAQGTAVNALDACKKLDCTPDELSANGGLLRDRRHDQVRGRFLLRQDQGFANLQPATFMADARGQQFVTAPTTLIYHDVEFDLSLVGGVSRRGHGAHGPGQGALRFIAAAARCDVGSALRCRRRWFLRARTQITRRRTREGLAGA